MQPTAITSSTCVPSRSSRNERKQWKISGFLNREGEGFDPFTCMFNDQPLPMCEEGGHYILTRQTPPDEVGLAVDLDTSPPIHLANPRDLAFGHWGAKLALGIEIGVLLKSWRQMRWGTQLWSLSPALPPSRKRPNHFASQERHRPTRRRIPSNPFPC